MTNENEIKTMLQSLLEGLKGIADEKTIVGQAVETKDGTVIIPVSKVAVGFGCGGGGNSFFGCGGGGGVTIDPVAFLVVSDGDVRLMYMNGEGTITSNLLSAIPGVVSMLIETFTGKSKENSNSDDTQLEFDDMFQD
jgi:sporulation protein YtfJ